MPENPGTCILHSQPGCALCLHGDDAVWLAQGNLYYHIVPDYRGGWAFHPFGTGAAPGPGELREAARRRQEEYARARAGQEAARAAAREKAEQVLLRWLSPAQERDYRERHRFDVTGSDGRRWRIQCAGQTGNVQLLDGDGGMIHVFCAHPNGLPDPVAWLTQAMTITHDAAGFLRTANFYGARSAEEAVAAEALAPGSANPFGGLLTAVLRLR